YDLKGKGLRDSAFTARYAQQCWALDVTFGRTPGDTSTNRSPEYRFMFMFELKGLGGLRLYEFSSQSQQKA
ncbi:MAG TPA: hypothetical protein VF790_13130, partial [Dissulfurispiraceae bacterium]